MYEHVCYLGRGLSSSGPRSLGSFPVTLDPVVIQMVALWTIRCSNPSGASSYQGLCWWWWGNPRTHIHALVPLGHLPTNGLLCFGDVCDGERIWIIPGSAQETIYSARNRIGVSCLQGKYLTLSLVPPHLTESQQFCLKIVF